MSAPMFRFFETRIDFRKQPPAESPPDTLWGFYWHFIAQAKGLFIALSRSASCSPSSRR